MKTVLFYFTGTGNSLAAARKIAVGLGECDVVSILADKAEERAAGAMRVGIVFPVYIWGVPPIVARFMEKLRPPSQAYVFAVSVAGGGGCGTVRQARRILRSAGGELHAGFEILLPNNYVPLGIPNEKKQQRMCAKASAKIDSIVASVQRGDRLYHPGWPFLNWVFSGILYKISIPHLAEIDKSFFASDGCNGCSMCAKVCPSANIEMANGRPKWLHRCEQCWACFHWCPQNAVQYGRNSAGKTRYHHPDVKAADLIRR
jgi:ferredoxin